MASSLKKAVVRTTEGLVLAGYLPPAGFVARSAQGDNEGETVELLDLEGRLVYLPLGEVRMIAFVRDFNLGEADPERLVRRTFLARPRSEGLWVRVRFQDGELLEGLAALDTSLLDGMLEDRGLHLMPPDARANTQRLFVPRSAMAELQVLGVITTPTRTQRATRQPRKDKDASGDLPFPQG